MGKGSARRPAQVSDNTVRDNWERIFGNDGKDGQADQVQRTDNA